LGIVCSGVAYLIYFRLIADFGGVSALTVAFLIPVFGTFWGAWLLGEPVTWSTLIGGTEVCIGSKLLEKCSGAVIKQGKTVRSDSDAR
jgi:drug/metabolite transporter (DMT)-like permease